MSEYDTSTGLEFLIKQPGEDRLYDVPFSGLLRTGDTLTSVVVAQENQGNVTGSTDLTLGAVSNDGATAQVRISEGTDGEDYKLEFTGTTTNGDTLEMDVMIKVRD